MFLSSRPRAILSRTSLFALTLVLSLLSVALTGCGMGKLAPASSAGGAGLSISGHVHGGQQPVAGAHVHVFQASFSGGGSFDLIASGQEIDQDPYTPQDSLGYYVPTDASGNFSITGDYLCVGGGPVYLLATQGNPGLASGTNNAALALLAVVADSCGEGDTLSSSLNIDVNELSTVAGVYALSGYLSAPNALTYPGSVGTAPTGLTNAAETAMALVNMSTGAVNPTTASGGTVPAAAISTLGNILAACINSDGSTTPVTTNNGTTTPNCGTLFANATADGTSTGTQPTDTVTAMLNIAHHPAANVAALFGLASAEPPFPGGLSTQPNDFTLAVGYSLTGDDLESPGVPAVDAGGDVWFPSTVPYITIGPASGYEEVELAPSGALLTGTSLSHPTIQVAIDPSNNPWFAFSSGGVVGHVSGISYSAYSYNGSSNDDGHQIAIDPSGNVYISDYTQGTINKLNNSGTAASGYSFHYNEAWINVVMIDSNDFFTSVKSPAEVGAEFDSSGYATQGHYPECSDEGTSCGLDGATAFAVDSNQHIWALNNNSTLADFTLSASTGVTGSPFSGGGLNTTTLSPNQPYPWLAIDGGNNVWVANYTGSLSEFANSGAAITPAYTSATQPGGYFGSTPSCKGQGLAIDGSGNIWVSCDNANGSPFPVLEYIGAATPVTTPLLPGNFGVKP